MTPIDVPGGTVQGWTSGDGEAVLVLHGSMVPDVFGPMTDQVDLADYRFIGYQRRGYADSSGCTTDDSIEDFAADAAAVLDHFGIDHAHVVGHSYGGRIAMQLALSEPDRVRSLSLFESGTNAGVASSAEFGGRVAEATALYRSGEHAAALDAMCRVVAGEKYREQADVFLAPGWFDRAVLDIGTVFDVEFPATSRWTFDSAVASRIEQPAMVLVGDDSFEIFKEMSAWLLEHLPNAEPASVPETAHFLQMTNPGGVAKKLRDFLARQPMS